MRLRNMNNEQHLMNIPMLVRHFTVVPQNTPAGKMMINEVHSAKEVEFSQQQNI